MGEELFEGHLAFEQGARPQVLAVQFEQIEGVILQRRGVLVQVAAQGLKVGLTPRADHDDFAIDHRALRLELRHRLAHGVELVGPVEAAAGISCHAALPQVRLRPKPVPLYLVHPPFSCRR